MRSKKAVSITTALGILTTVLLLGFAASASAQSPGLDQYTESIPGAGGNQTTDKGDNGGNGDGGGGTDSTPAPTVSSDDLDALRSQGRNGERAAAALEATSGNSDSEGSGGSKKESTGGSLSEIEKLDSSEADGKNPVEAVLSSMVGGSTGAALPLILLAVLIGGLVIAARKRAGADSAGTDSIDD